MTISRRTDRAKPAVPPRIAAEAAASDARASASAVSCAFAIPLDGICASTRRAADVAFGRQVAIYLTRVGFEHRLADVGRAFGRDRTTAAHACRVVEDRRDDPVFDIALLALEGGLAAWVRSFASAA